MIYKVSRLTIEVCTYLIRLFDANQTVINDWSAGWYRGVSSLYASEIAINHVIIGNNSLSLKTFVHDPDYIKIDAHSTNRRNVNFVKNIIHIHAWQMNDIFNKFDWINNETDHFEAFTRFKRKLEQSQEPYYLDSVEIREYCLVIANDLHLELSTNLFNIDSMLLQMQQNHG